MRKYFYLLLSVTFYSCGQPSATREEQRQQPNIVIIMADDMGYSDLGCYGSDIQTPNIDRLASEGIRFRQVYNNAFCSPSRASLLTGLFPQSAGMGELANPHPGPPGPNQGYLNNSCVTLAEVLKTAGYSTIMSGKWHLGELKPHWPCDRGFDHYFGLISGAANYYDIRKTKSPKVVRTMAMDNEAYTPPDTGFYMTDAITSNALRLLLTEQKKANPYFLYVAYTAPHWPLHALPADIAKYKDKFLYGWDSMRLQRYHRQLKEGILKGDTQLSPRDAEVRPWDQLSAGEKEAMALKMAVYAAQIDRMDQGIGKILDLIKASGKEDNTIVMFMADNGGCAEGGIEGFDLRKNGLPPGGEDSYMSYGQSWANASNTPFRYFKKWVHEGGISTPFIIRWPSKIAVTRRGGFSDQVAHFVDIMPTLCEVAHARYPAKFGGNSIQAEDGQSMLPAILKDTVLAHKPMYWLINGHKAIIKDGFKLVTAAPGANAPWQLYNLQNDRAELHDLSASMPGRVAEMKLLWEKWAVGVGVLRSKESSIGE
ncbi:MAG TPA: arylsulfatase [Chitinophagaceae bacterium]|nr:arylsulfatase [Chitinophagaceae bacterium]